MTAVLHCDIRHQGWDHHKAIYELEEQFYSDLMDFMSKFGSFPVYYHWYLGCLLNAWHLGNVILSFSPPLNECIEYTKCQHLLAVFCLYFALYVF